MKTSSSYYIALLLAAALGLAAFTEGFQSIPITTNVRSSFTSSFQLQSTADPNDALSLQKAAVSRRQTFELAFAAIGLTTTFAGTRENTPQDYGLWPSPENSHHNDTSFLV